jgi:hypothetical protein
VTINLIIIIYCKDKYFYNGGARLLINSTISQIFSDVQLQMTFPVQARIIGRDYDNAHIVCIVI